MTHHQLTRLWKHNTHMRCGCTTTTKGGCTCKIKTKPTETERSEVGPTKSDSKFGHHPSYSTEFQDAIISSEDYKKHNNPHTHSNITTSSYGAHAGSWINKCNLIIIVVIGMLWQEQHKQQSRTCHRWCTPQHGSKNTASESTRRKNLGQLLINCSEDQLALATTCSHTARNHPKFVKLAESS
jgi:hypothetical protein